MKTIEFTRDELLTLQIVVANYIRGLSWMQNTLEAATMRIEAETLYKKLNP